MAQAHEVDLTADPGIDRTGIREMLKLTPAERARRAAAESKVLDQIDAARLVQRS